jgi:hypothetical protein
MTSQGGTMGTTGNNADRDEEGQQWDNNNNEDGGTTMEKRPKGHCQCSLAIGKFFLFSFIFFLMSTLF